MAYGKKYFMSFERTFTNPKGVSVTKNFLFNIYFNGYAGTPTELPCMGDSPVSLRWDGDKDNIFEPILKGSMEFELINMNTLVFDDMIEASDSDCWCELVEQTDAVPHVIGYNYEYDTPYSKGFISFYQDNRHPIGSHPRNSITYVKDFGLEINGVKRYMTNAPDNMYVYKYSDPYSFDFNKEQAFKQLLDSLNQTYNQYGLTFYDKDYLNMGVKSVDSIDVKRGSYGLSSSYMQLDFKRLVRQPIYESNAQTKLIFSGFLSPAGIVRPYTNSPSVMKFTASDGLNLLDSMSYGEGVDDLKYIKVVDLLKGFAGFRNRIVQGPIKDDLYIEWDLKGNTSGGISSGGSVIGWDISKIIYPPYVPGEKDPAIYVMLQYSVIVKVYKIDGVNYDTYVFRNKSENDKIQVWLVKDPGRYWERYTQEQINNDAATKLANLIQDELKKINVNSQVVPTLPVKMELHSSSKIEIDSIMLQDAQLTKYNSYTPVTIDDIDLSTITVGGETFAGKSMYKVIEGVMKSFGWRMYYYNGWRVERVINIGKTNRNFYKYNLTDNTQAVIKLGVVKDEGSDFYIESGATETRINSWRDVIFKQPYGKKESLIYNKTDKEDFEYSREFNAYAYKWAYGDAYCMKDKSGENLLIGTRDNSLGYAKFYGKADATSVSVNFIGISDYGVTVSIKLKIGNKWLTSGGGLSDTEQTISKTTPAAGASPKLITEAKIEVSFDSQGENELELWISNQSTASGSKDVLVSEFFVGGSYLKESSVGYELQLNINQLNRNKTKTVEFMLGSVLDLPVNPSFYSGLLKVGDNYVYQMGDGLNVGRLADIIGNEYAYVYNKNRMCISGTIMDFVEPTDSLRFANGKMLTFASIGSLDVKRNMMDGEFVEVVGLPFITKISDFPDLSIAPLDVANFPATAIATYSNGTESSVPVTWEAFKSDRSGVFVVKGFVGVNIENAEQKVAVGKIVSYTPLVDVHAVEGLPATLPTKAHCTTDNGFERDYDITWGDYSTTTEGEYTITGTVVTGFEVSVKLIVAAVSDLDILRQIRDANPNSQLPALWSEDKDPYTQWEGVTWNSSKRVVGLDMQERGLYGSLSVSGLAALTDFNCSGNRLQSVDVSKNTALVYFNCSKNPLQSVDVTKNVNLVTFSCSFNQLQSVDVSKNTALVNFNCSKNPLQSVDVTKNVNLVTFGCSFNQLQSVDVSKNTALVDFDCNNNQLQSVDVTKNVNLVTFSCSFNQLQSVDVSKNTALVDFYCNNNQLQSITVFSKNLIVYYDFSFNYLEEAELNRLRSLGFTDESGLLPQKQ